MEVRTHIRTKHRLCCIFIDFYIFITYIWGLSWSNFSLQAIWKLNLVFYLNCLWTTVTLVSHSNVDSEAFRHGHFSTWIALSFSCLLWSWSPVIPACSRSPAPWRYLPSSLFISTRAWRRGRLRFCQGRGWTDRELLGENWAEGLQDTGTGTFTSSKLDEQILHFLSLTALAFYKAVTWIPSL